jgi:hypothetical protein
MELTSLQPTAFVLAIYLSIYMYVDLDRKKAILFFSHFRMPDCMTV